MATWQGCCVYYEDHQGPSCDNRNLVSVHFKRPSHHPTPPTPKKKRSLHHAASIPTELFSQASQDSTHIAYKEPVTVTQHTLYTDGEDTYTEERDTLHTGDQDTLHTGGQDTYTLETKIHHAATIQI